MIKGQLNFVVTAVGRDIRIQELILSINLTDVWQNPLMTSLLNWKHIQTFEDIL